MSFRTFSFAMLLLLLAACSREKHFISDPVIRARVEERFKEQRALAVNRDSVLFSVFDQHLSTEEEEALKFLYAYMPLVIWLTMTVLSSCRT
jgi:hypothetical protein